MYLEDRTVRTSVTVYVMTNNVCICQQCNKTHCCTVDLKIMSCIHSDLTSGTAWSRFCSWNVDEYNQACLHVCLPWRVIHTIVWPWKCHHEASPCINTACLWILCCPCVMCCISLCVWREPTVSRLSDYLNNLSLLSFPSLNPRWGCSSGTQRDKSASGASFPVI